MDVVNVKALKNIKNINKIKVTHNIFALYIIKTFTEYSEFARQAQQPVDTLCHTNVLKHQSVIFEQHRLSCIGLYILYIHA